MARHVLLNNVDHRNLRVVTDRGTRYGDGVAYAMTFPSEFRSIQAHYPIVFRKEPGTGSFVPIAMFGFREGENLFLTESGWDAHYVPMTMERGPFLIGRQDPTLAGSDNPAMVITIDADSPRLSETEGERVFHEHGGVTEYLNRMNELLGEIHSGAQSNPGFIAELLEHDLLESFTLDIQLADGSEHRLGGFYTIHEERMEGLDAQALKKLSGNGVLKACYFALASLSHFRDLIARRTARLAAIAAGC